MSKKIALSGVPNKSPLVMQILTDVLDMKIMPSSAEEVKGYDTLYRHYLQPGFNQVNS